MKSNKWLLGIAAVVGAIAASSRAVSRSSSSGKAPLSPAVPVRDPLQLSEPHDYTDDTSTPIATPVNTGVQTTYTQEDTRNPELAAEYAAAHGASEADLAHQAAMFAVTAAVAAAKAEIISQGYSENGYRENPDGTISFIDVRSFPAVQAAIKEEQRTLGVVNGVQY